MAGREALRLIAGFAKDIVYPRTCAGCGSRGAWLCELCEGSLDLFAPPWCVRCGIPSTLAGCRCHELPASIAMARSVGPFAGWLRSSVIALKYEDESDRAGHLGQMLAAVAPVAPDPVLAPVPLHESRLRTRGYNQSMLLAREAGRVRGWPVADLLVRTRATSSQVTLGAAQRRGNVAGAFALAPGTAFASPGPTVILVDDVMTTGSTLGACAEPLLAAGAAAVVAITVARDL